MMQPQNSVLMSQYCCFHLVRDPVSFIAWLNINKVRHTKNHWLCNNSGQSKQLSKNWNWKKGNHYYFIVCILYFYISWVTWLELVLYQEQTFAIKTNWPIKLFWNWTYVLNIKETFIQHNISLLNIVTTVFLDQLSAVATSGTKLLYLSTRPPTAKI